MSPGPGLIAFVDIETLGLDPDEHAVWEVAVIIYDPARAAAGEPPVVDVLLWHLELTDDELELADPIAQELTGFHERYGRGVTVTPKAKAIELIVEAVGEAHLAGAVVSFDEERLRRLARRHGVTPRWHYHLIDTEALMVGYMAGVRAAQAGASVTMAYDERTLPWKVRELSLAVGVDTEDHQPAHTAAADAGWALACYEAVVGRGN